VKTSTSGSGGSSTRSTPTSEYDKSSFTFDPSVDGGSFVVFIPASVDQTIGGAMNNITALKENLWVDERTRSVKVQFLTYNGNYALFDIIELGIEFHLGGTVDKSISITTVDLEFMWLDTLLMKDLYRSICEVLVLFYVISFAVGELQDLRAIHREHEELTAGNVFKLYVSEIWNILDLITIVLFVVYYVVYFAIYIISQNITVKDKFTFPQDQPVLFELLNNLAYAADSFQTLQTVSMLNVFCCLAKMFKYFDAQGRLAVINKTFAIAAQDLAHFCIMLFAVMWVFSLIAYQTFGTKMANFANKSTAFHTVYRFCLGDFDFDALYEAGGGLGLLYFYAITLFIIFIMVNVFLAIVMDSYAEANEHAKNESSVFEEIFNGGRYYYLTLRGKMTKQLLIVPDELIQVSCIN
jgi:hypothetical protein